MKCVNADTLISLRFSLPVYTIFFPTTMAALYSSSPRSTQTAATEPLIGTNTKVDIAVILYCTSILSKAATILPTTTLKNPIALILRGDNHNKEGTINKSIIIIVMEDQVYCFEIARRSVGRAALHLGIESMSEASLDVMADVLLSYLNRVGKSMSHLVESSGRSSAHVNILDAFRACEMVSAPVAQRLHLRDGSEEQLFGTATTTNAAAATSAQQQHNTADWKGLAAFLFGPKWLEETEEDDEEKVSNGPGGGKRGPSATTGEISADTKVTGWNAPYLDEIPPYPLASDQCANPHSLPAQIGLSLHREEAEQEDKAETEEELEMIPDDIFATKSWGDMGMKRKLDRASGESDKDPETSSPPTKRARIVNDRDKDGAKKDEQQQGGEQHPPNFVPSFFPKPPVTKRSSDEGRMAVDMEKHPLNEISRETDYQGVRSSLVEQSSYYWGSSWDSKSSSHADLAVPLGRWEPKPKEKDEKPEKDKDEKSTKIVPIPRASGSRVSRILEGSMDAAAMQ